MSDQYDSPWKDILTDYLPEFMAFFFPLVYQEVDWTRPPVFLDKELQQVSHDAETGNRRVDKLVRVWLINGQERWVLIHIEIQSSHEKAFPQRMYVYNYRIFDRFGRHPASFAILTDGSRSWRPRQYKHEIWTTKVQLDFETIKLVDYQADWAAVEANSNPFALVVMAHLKTMETRRDMQQRFDWKVALTEMLYERAYTEREITNLFRFIDWVVRLPDELAVPFNTRVQEIEETRRMRYVTTIERLGIQKGREEGLEEGIRKSVVRILKRRFEHVSLSFMEQLETVDEEETLLRLLDEAVMTQSVDDFGRYLNTLVNK